MNYYPFHLGDYAAHTGHLEPMEDLAYRRLLDVYYMREGALPADIQVTAKLVRLRPCAADVESVLNEFFVLTTAGWINRRADSEIDAMRDKQQKQRDKANKRWHKPEPEPGNAPAMPRHGENDATASENDADAMPPTPTPTPTPTPITKEEGEKPRKRDSRPVVGKPDDVDQQTWDDWLSLRKAKRAPVTETVVKGARDESVKAGMTLDAFLQVWCRRGSQGLEAGWLRPEERSTQSRASTETAYQRSMRERMQVAAPEFARKDPSKPMENVIDFFAIEVPAQRLEIGNEPAASLG